ncbi:Dynamin-related protein 3A [Citrus sinensis]|uniref:Dynamin-related protein 3A n=1 Tax=Citrus sinensis TaxID=2711 RepID=A0ACB8NLH8_CITSI|nr:Dynamin-related protein 3A [Citrus sinensis]
MGEEASFSNKNVAASTTIGSSVIPIINRLQDIFSPVDGELSKISLPQVAVVGSQSSGKSSVLEALVGRDFLPRGCDICTRRPLALMLVNRPRNPGDDGREWAEFRHLPGKRFFDFTKVRQEIMVIVFGMLFICLTIPQYHIVKYHAETNKEAGSNRGVSEKQIGLKISSPNVLNMTLVDLPGITKVPVGDQPTDIEARIRKMIMAYIRQENCIILAVSPANSDLATSDALQMAREADPTGSRTIGVITKLDIMDRGTNACNFLLGKVVPLRLGYVGVVNRSQEDINKNRSMQDALAYEKNFFRDHPVYNGLSDRCGIPQLAKKLNQILEQHIRMVLPGLKSELHSRLNAVAKELQKYGDVMESKAEKETMLLNILTKYCEAFSAMVDGRSQEISTKELSGGARIRYIFQSIFVKTLEEVDPCQDLTDEDIRTAIQNATGPRNALFVPEVPFEVLVRRQIARLLDPCLQCLRFVYDELIKMSHACAVTELQRFPVLRRHLDDVMGKFIRDSVRPAERMIDSLIEIEPPSILGPLEMTEQEAVEILVTKLLLQSYYDVVRKNVQDLVPKSIMHFLVNHAKRNLHNTFIQKLYRENHVEELLQEHDEVAANRRQVKEVSLVLQQAVQTLDEVESEYLPET